MNRLTLSTAAAIVALWTVPTQAANVGKIQNVNPKLALLGTPEFGASIAGLSAPKRPRPPAPGENKLWLEFETDFDSVEDFTEVTFKYGLVIAMPGRPLKLVEGEVTHVDVLKGKDRHSVMYIAPKTLNKLCEGKTFALTNVKAYWVDITSQGETVGGIAKPSIDVYNQVQKNKESLEKSPESLLNKKQTPFAPLFGGYFEELKSSR